MFGDLFGTFTSFALVTCVDMTWDPGALQSDMQIFAIHISPLICNVFFDHTINDHFTYLNQKYYPIKI